MKYIILGASSGLGREISYLLAKKKNDLIIISRDERDLRAIKNDLEIQFNINIIYFQLDLSSFEKIQNFFKSNPNIIDEIDGILIPVGMTMENDVITNDIENSNQLIQANLGSVIYFVSKFLPTFIKKNKGSIVGFGSVSAIIGREKNAVYASAKRALESFFESLIIKTLSTNLKIQFYVVGYLNTNLSYGKKLFLPKGSPQKLAKIVYKNLNQNYYKKYFPFWWIYINFILKILPFFIIKAIYSLIFRRNEK
jgi:17beta-estradiol 17-dehydrogenase / very-long-chain 3-oxoacyl-CoA reductase